MDNIQYAIFDIECEIEQLKIRYQKSNNDEQFQIGKKIYYWKDTIENLKKAGERI